MERLKRMWKDLVVLAVTVASGVAVALVLSSYFHIAIVSGNSMNPTLKDGWVLKCDTDTSGADINDIVIVDVDGHPTLVKRIVGKPGDELTIKNGELYRNGVKEELGLEMMAVNNYGCLSETRIYTVPDGCFFIMGDNRNNSVDSREIGAVPKESVILIAEGVMFHHADLLTN